MPAAAKLVLAVVLLTAARPLTAAEWYVDNLRGDDAFNGSSRDPLSGENGPLRTIRRALSRAGSGDTIHLANSDQPYYESLQLFGPKHSGVANQAFVIHGHGAVISGERRIPANQWRDVGGGLWQLMPFRKGYYELLFDGTPVPEHPGPKDSASVGKLPEGTWRAWHGSIYYQARNEQWQTPFDLTFSIAADDVGISLLDVRNVVIQQLTVRHFRVDGVNAHDRAVGVILDDVTLLENGRAGLAVGGSSLVGLKDSTCRGNRLFQLLNSERAQTELLHSTLGAAPGIPLRVEGGHVLIDGVEPQAAAKD